MGQVVFFGLISFSLLAFVVAEKCPDYTVIGDADPHMVIRLKGVDIPVCYDLLGHGGETYVLFKMGEHFVITGTLFEKKFHEDHNNTYFDTINFEDTSNGFLLRVNQTGVLLKLPHKHLGSAERTKMKVSWDTPEDAPLDNPEETGEVPKQTTKETVWPRGYRGIWESEEEGIKVNFAQWRKINVEYKGLRYMIYLGKRNLKTTALYKAQLLKYLNIYLAPEHNDKELFNGGILGEFVGQKAVLEKTKVRTLLHYRHKAIEVVEHSQRSELHLHSTFKCWLVPKATDILQHKNVDYLYDLRS